MKRCRSSPGLTKTDLVRFPLNPPRSSNSIPGHTGSRARCQVVRVHRIRHRPLCFSRSPSRVGSRRTPVRQHPVSKHPSSRRRRGSLHTARRATAASSLDSDSLLGLATFSRDERAALLSSRRVSFLQRIDHTAPLCYEQQRHPTLDDDDEHDDDVAAASTG